MNLIPNTISFISGKFLRGNDMSARRWVTMTKWPRRKYRAFEAGLRCGLGISTSCICLFVVSFCCFTDKKIDDAGKPWHVRKVASDTSPSPKKTQKIYKIIQVEFKEKKLTRLDLGRVFWSRLGIPDWNLHVLVPAWVSVQQDAGARCSTTRFQGEAWAAAGCCWN